MHLLGFLGITIRQDTNAFQLNWTVLLFCVASRAKDSMYHALGYSTIVVLQAIMTFEQQDIQNGISAMKDALQTCQKYEPSN